MAGMARPGMAQVVLTRGSQHQPAAWWPLFPQMVVASTAAMFLVVIPGANAALGGRSFWAVFVVTLIHEPSTGAAPPARSALRAHALAMRLLAWFNPPPQCHPLLAGGVVFKGLMRLAGTILGGLAGMAAMYFTFLCNGASYDNQPAKVGYGLACPPGRTVEPGMPRPLVSAPC